MSRLIDRCPGLAETPAVRLLAYTDRIRTALAGAQPQLDVPVALKAQNRDGMLFEGMRAWALTWSEVGVPRLPGGAVSDDYAGFGSSAHHQECVCGDWRSHQGDGWYRLLCDTLDAARDRDGHALFAVMQRAFDPGQENQSVSSYLSSLAGSSCKSFDESSAGRDHDALLHMLACQAVTATHYSVAGPVYRVCASLLTVMDMGPQFADTVVGPEIDRIARMRAVEQVAAIGMLAPLYGQFMVDDPDQRLDPNDLTFHAHKAGCSATHSQTSEVQALSGTIGMRFALAVRCGGAADLIAVAESLDQPQIALGVYGLCNLLAMRVRALFGR